MYVIYIESISRGLSDNAVLMTFYYPDTIHEKDKFLADAKRLALDMSQNQTFSTVQPLMNFWAAFSPSQEVCLSSLSPPQRSLYFSGLLRVE